MAADKKNFVPTDTQNLGAEAPDDTFSISDEKLFEIAGRAPGAQPEYIYLNDDIDNIAKARKVIRPSVRWGSSLKPNSNILIEMPGPEGAKFDLVCTDESGVSRNTSDGTDLSGSSGASIAFLGGSTVMGTGSRKPEWTIPAQVETLLKAKGIDSNCLNYGVAGMTSRDSLAQLIDMVLPRKPQLVIFYTGWNCAFNFQLNALRVAAGAFHIGGIHKGLGSRQAELMEQLAVNFKISGMLRRVFWISLNLMSTKIKAFMPTSRIGSMVIAYRKLDPTLNNRAAGRWVKSITGTQETFIDEAAQDYLRFTSAAAAICKDVGVKFLCFFQPNLFWGQKPLTPLETGFLRAEPVDPASQTAFYDAVMRLSQTSDLIDLSEVFSRESRQLYIDTGHLNPLGNYLVSRHISDHLEPLLQ